MATSQLQALLDSLDSRLSTVEKTVLGSSAAPVATSRSAPGEAPAVVTAFDEYCSKNLDPFVAACDKLGGGAAQGGAVIKKAWMAQRELIAMAASCKKPDPASLMPRLAPLQTCMAEARDCQSRDEFENHTKAIAEATGCVTWVQMYPPSGLPKELIEPTIGGSDYWSNRIRTQYRKTSPDQIAFCDTLKALLTQLMDYVQAHHKTGLTWNPSGVNVEEYSGGEAEAARGGSVSLPSAPAAAPAPARPAMEGNQALFGELSKGLAVTAGLKKVTKEDKKALKAAPVLAAPKTAPKPPALATKGPPKMEFVQTGMKWIVENQSGAEGVVTVDITNMKHQVYIYGCMGATIDIKGKCKMVAIDGCKKTQVLLDDAISSVELVNCQRVQVQVRGSVPSVAVDKTDGFLCYLGKNGLETTFTTSKSSEMNVAFPKPGQEDEQLEMPIPEQFVHKLKLDGRSPSITSDVSDLYSH